MRSLPPIVESAVLGAILVALPSHASAAPEGTCPAPEGASETLSRVDPEERLAFVSDATRRAGEKAALWGSFWRATFQVAAGAQIGLAKATTDEATRIDLTAGALKSSVGLIFGYVFMLPAERHHDAFGRARAQGVEQDERPLCERLAEEETRLANDAKGERRGRSVGMHALGLGFNVAVGIGSGLMSKRWSTVILGMVVGSIVGSTRIFTQPTVATEAWEAYSQGRVPKKTQVSVAPWIAPTGSGLELGIAASF